MIIFSVRDQKKRLFRILAGFDLGQTKIDGIIERRGAFCGCEGNPVSKPADIGREVFGQLRVIRKLD